MARRDVYKRLARAMADQERAGGPPLRDLLKIREHHLRLAAVEYGWRRVGAPAMAPDGTGPYVTWTSPWGVYVALEVSVLPELLRQKVIADQILHMSGICRVCGAEAKRDEDGDIVCEHQPACSVSAESIFSSSESAAN